MKNTKKIIIISALLLLNIYNGQNAYSEEISPSAISDTNASTAQAAQQNQTNVTPELQQPDLQSEITLNKAEQQMPITLEESLKIALENNYNIKIISTQKNQSKWLYYNNITDFLPDFYFDYNQSRFGGEFLIGGLVPISTSATNINTGFTAQWDGFTGLRRYFDLKASKNNYKAAKKNVEYTQEETLIRTTTQYYALLQDKLNIDILKRNLEQTEAQLKINQQKFEAGVGTKFDVLRAESEVALAKQQLIAAYNRLRLSQAQLANTLGIDVFTPLMPVQDTVDARTLFKDCFNLEKVTEIALESRPDLDIAKLNIAAARARRNSAYSIYLPTVSVRSTVFGTGNEVTDLSRNQSVALVVGWRGAENMGLDGLTSIKVLNAQVQESKYQYENTARNIEQSLLNSYYNILTAKELMQAANTQVIAADESLRLAFIRLEAGVGIYTDVLQAQASATSAKINYLNSIINYNVSQSQLLFDMGVISVNNLLEGYGLENEAQDKQK